VYVCFAVIVPQVGVVLSVGFYGDIGQHIDLAGITWNYVYQIA